MDDIKDKLLRKAYLYADTGAYRAGVEAALAAVQAQGEPVQDQRSEDQPVVVSLQR